MPRLIDADALIVSECGQCDGACDICDGEYCLKCNSHNKCQLREAIDYAPTIDAENVVRCKDCKHRGNIDECPMRYCEYVWDHDDGGLDEDVYDVTEDDGFCHRGVKKDATD